MGVPCEFPMCFCCAGGFSIVFCKSFDNSHRDSTNFNIELLVRKTFPLRESFADGTIWRQPTTQTKWEACYLWIYPYIHQIPYHFFLSGGNIAFLFYFRLGLPGIFFQNIRVCDLSTKGCAWNVPVRRRMTSVTNFGNQHFPLAQGHAHCQTCHSGKVVIGSDCKAGEVNMQTSTVCHQLFMFCRDAFDFSHWQRMQMDDSCIEPFQN